MRGCLYGPYAVGLGSCPVGFGHWELGFGFCAVRFGVPRALFRDLRGSFSGTQRSGSESVPRPDSIYAPPYRPGSIAGSRRPALFCARCVSVWRVIGFEFEWCSRLSSKDGRVSL
eukprot:1790168-Rhodomonas_salina.1